MLCCPTCGHDIDRSGNCQCSDPAFAKGDKEYLGGALLPVEHTHKTTCPPCTTAVECITVGACIGSAI